ncbi:MAG: formylglycine-generating enzyme family protein, partial [Flavobacteriales bacterium]
MKNTLILIIGSIVLFGCTQGPQGELVGVKDPLWYQENPYGMNYIDAGSFTMGPSDQDVPFAMNSRAKTVTVPAFYMDDTEITNREYRQFVEFVVDSVLVDAFVE